MNKAQKSICLLVYSAVPDDPRVRRQGEAFIKAGWKVRALGLPGGKSDRLPWMPDYSASENMESGGGQADGSSAPEGSDGGGKGAGSLGPRTEAVAEALPIDKKHSETIKKPNRVARLLRLALLHALVPISDRMADRVYWKIFPNADDIYQLAFREPADVWLVNDWHMIPVAEKLARKHGGVVGYDTHEFALNEYSQKLSWRLLRKPLVSRIEGSLMRTAPVCSTVSSGIAFALKDIHGLSELPLVVRNVPSYQKVERQTPSQKLRVLYHGIVAPGRGLEACIESVPHWRQEFNFTIRGPAQADYGEFLKSRIKDLGLSERVYLAPPVPMTELVREAAKFDIGLFALPDHSLHNRFALPNKLFEYIMAGLVTCVSDLPEMKEIVSTYGTGITFSGMDPQAIAAAINDLDRTKIDTFGAKSLEAAQELCWETEGQKMVDAYECVVENH